MWPSPKAAVCTYSLRIHPFFGAVFFSSSHFAMQFYYMPHLVSIICIPGYGANCNTNTHSGKSAFCSATCITSGTGDGAAVSQTLLASFIGFVMGAVVVTFVSVTLNSRMLPNHCKSDHAETTVSARHYPEPENNSEFDPLFNEHAKPRVV